MFESRLDQTGQTVGVETDAGRDQVDVESGLGGIFNEFDEIAPHQRLAAGEMDLKDPECGRLVEHAAPGRRVELGAGAGELPWVRAIGTAQRAAMGQFGEQRKRWLDRRHCRNTFLSTRSCNIGTTSPAMTSRGASNCPASSSTIASTSRLPSIKRRIATACSSGSNSRSGASTIHALRRSSKRKRTCGAKIRTALPSSEEGEAVMGWLVAERKHLAGLGGVRHRRSRARRAGSTGRHI